MGQAKRRKQQLGALYGTPAGSPPPSPKALARLMKLPPVDAITATISRADQIAAAGLFNGTAATFRQSFQPTAQAKALGLAEVVVWADGSAAGVELVPATAS